MVWILVSILVALIVMAVLAIFMVKKAKDKGKPKQIDYKTFFYMGIIWMLVGVYPYFLYGETTMTGLFGMGVVFFLMGLANKDKWGKKTQAPMTPKQKYMFAITFIVAIALVVTLFFLF